MDQQATFSSPHLTGILLIASLLLGLLALVIMVARGAFPAFSAVIQGSLEAMVPHAATFRLTTLMFGASWILQLLGFGLLTLLLLRAGDEQLPILAFILILFASILGVLYATFRMSVDPWAAQAALQTGSVPEIYEPLRDWIDNSFRMAYLAHFAAVVGFGWAILRTGLLADWVGWATIGWSVLWLVGSLAGVGAPGIPFIMPAVIGVALLWG